MKTSADALRPEFDDNALVMKRAVLALLLASAAVSCDNDKSTISEVQPAAPAPPAPAFTPTPVPTPVPASNNQPPSLVFKIRPDPASGPAPWPVNVNMCQSSDPEGDPLIFEYKWGGEGRPDFSRSCRMDHTYTNRGNFHAFFCVHDDHDHRVCWNELIGIS
jgi:hypothetical protein